MANDALFVGHSLVNQTMPQMLNRLLAGTGMRADAQVINGAPLQWQWQNGAGADGVNARAVLPSGRYEALILTEALPLADAIQWSDTDRYAREYAQLAWAAQSGARVMIYETWSYFGPDEWNPSLPRYTDAQWRAQITADRALWQGIADGLNAVKPADDAEVIVVPGGTALGRLHDAILIGQGQGLTGIRDLFSDLVHLNDAGNYLIALVQHAALTGKAGIGLPSSLTDAWGAQYTGWTEAQAVLFQHLAWEAVALESRAPTQGADPVVRIGNTEANRLQGGTGDDRLHGQAGADVLIGGRGRDLVTGDAGADELQGQSGRDWLSGGAGRDTLAGGSLRDSLFGGADDDWLRGGSGADQLSGEAGADTFQFGRGHGSDTIRDFQLSEGDRLMLAARLVNGASAAEVIDRFGTELGDHVQLDFGNGDRILLSNLASLSGLAAAIDIM